MGPFVAVANALTVSFSDVFIKKLKGEDTFFLIWLRLASALPILALAVTIFSEWHVPELSFWLIIAVINTPLEIFQFYVGYHAIQRSPLSLMAPLHASTSIFLIPVGYVILGEQPTMIGLVGIFTIVAGAFVLGWRIGQTHSLSQSIANVFAEPGTVLILTGSFLVSISIVTTRYVVTNLASPFLTAFYLTAAIALALTPIAFRRGTGVSIAGHGGMLGGLSILSGFSFGLHYFGLSLMPAAYFISIKRVSMLFNVIGGRVFFHEDHIRERFAGALLMIAGVMLIALG
ncbi:DMT family transporter [Candidatus Parcubacteria bacterium]|nr:MAG: DMT family transporter [Candidatus Parcubacteria bacterium]